MWRGNAHFFAIINVIQVVLFVLIAFIEMKNPRFYPENLGKFFYEEKHHSVPME